MPPAASTFWARRHGYTGSLAPAQFSIVKATALQVEGLAPQHWREHLERLKPGEQEALRRCEAAACSHC